MKSEQERIIFIYIPPFGYVFPTKKEKDIVRIHGYPDNKESLTFTNWPPYRNQPDNYGGREHWGYMYSDGDWFDGSDTVTCSHLVCELS